MIGYGADEAGAFAESGGWHWHECGIWIDGHCTCICLLPSLSVAPAAPGGAQDEGLQMMTEAIRRIHYSRHWDQFMDDGECYLCERALHRVQATLMGIIPPGIMARKQKKGVL